MGAENGSSTHACGFAVAGEGRFVVFHKIPDDCSSYCKGTGPITHLMGAMSCHYCRGAAEEAASKPENSQEAWRRAARRAWDRRNAQQDSSGQLRCQDRLGGGQPGHP